jgi:hypothetical protein
LIGPVRLSAEAAYLPYASFKGEDNHFLPDSGALDGVFPEWGHDRGVQNHCLRSVSCIKNSKRLFVSFQDCCDT